MYEEEEENKSVGDTDGVELEVQLYHAMLRRDVPMLITILNSNPVITLTSARNRQGRLMWLLLPFQERLWIHTAVTNAVLYDAVIDVLNGDEEGFTDIRELLKSGNPYVNLESMTDVNGVPMWNTFTPSEQLHIIEGVLDALES